MSDTGIRRILVALDASEPRLGALQSAAMLANQLHAELQALFVEDINLLRLAELPFARELVFGSHEGRRITLSSMERQIQQQTTRLRSMVDALARQQHINVDFKVLRGHVSEQLSLAAQQMDLLLVGRPSSRLQQRDLTSDRQARDILSTVNCNVLLLRHGSVIERPVAVLFDGSDTSQRALRLAIQLAHGDHDQLKVIYPAGDTQKQNELQQQVNALTQPLAIDVDQIVLHSNSSDALLAATLRFNSRMLIVEANNSDFDPETVRNLIQHSPVPVIVMR